MVLSFSDEPIVKNDVLPGILIFLDFDGTTRPLSWLGDTHPCEPTLVKFLWELEDEGLSPAVVVSSTWKRHRSKKSILKNMSPDLAQFVIGATPDTMEHVAENARSEEVDLFFKKTGWGHLAWVALDDELRLFKKEDHKCVWVANPETGMTMNDIPQIHQAVTQAFKEQIQRMSISSDSKKTFP